MIDSHCHIDLPPFDHDRADVIRDAIEKGIESILVPGLFAKQFQTLIDFKTDYHYIDIAFGFHPYFLRLDGTNNVERDMQILENTISKNRELVCAIGETGLDGVIETPITQQIAYLSGQLELAMKYSLPIILHHRKSHNELIRTIKSLRYTGGGVIHAFSGSADIANTYIDMGFKLGIGGTITYERAKKTINAISIVGLEHLLLETDSPDMPLKGYQGQRNTPLRLPIIVDNLAEILGVTSDDVISATSANYRSLFHASEV